MTSGLVKLTNFSENQLTTLCQSRVRLNLGVATTWGPVPPSPRPQRETATASGDFQWRRNYGDRGVHCTPQVQDLYPLYPPSQRCGVCQNFKQTTLTTTLYKVRTNLYPPPTYENVPTRLMIFTCALSVDSCAISYLCTTVGGSQTTAPPEHTPARNGLTPVPLLLLLLLFAACNKEIIAAENNNCPGCCSLFCVQYTPTIPWVTLLFR